MDDKQSIFGCHLPAEFPTKPGKGSPTQEGSEDTELHTFAVAFQAFGDLGPPLVIAYVVRDQVPMAFGWVFQRMLHWANSPAWPIQAFSSRRASSSISRW